MANETKYYCVGTYWKGSDPENQLDRFKANSIWENGYDDRFFAQVNSVPVNARLAAKSSYTRKKDGKIISVLEIQALGTVIANHKNGQTLDVKWDDNFVPYKLDGKGAYRSTINKVNSEENIKLIFNKQTTPSGASLDFDEADLQHEFPSNLILYGPPGTGKTYGTIGKAVSIIDGIKESALQKHYETREDLKERFDELMVDGQVSFITFHQSMSYEDFIEGIKPVMDEEEEYEEKMAYTIVDGIFKEICVKAKFECYRSIKIQETDPTNITRAEVFNIAYEEILSKFEEELDNGKVPEVDTKNGSKIEIIKISPKRNLTVKHKDGKRPYTVSQRRLLKLFNHFKDLSKIKNAQKEFRAIMGGANVSAYWALLSKIDSICQNLPKSISTSEEIAVKDYNTMKATIENFTLSKEILAKGSPEKYVLIIDEINRGNVSQIFGELITLLEADKREGNGEALEVKLPYSKDRFSVPPNLHIIGTMNTADRSVEALDAALRRRFNFEFIEPQANNTDEKLTDSDISPRQIFEKINERITYLLDEDHQIGHSYFMKLKGIEDLKTSFKNNIIPLLKEYFYNDYGKIRMVLGNGFVEKVQEGKAKPQFPKGTHDEVMEFDKVVYKIHPLGQTTFDEAIKLLTEN